MNVSNRNSTDKIMTSQFEGCLASIQDQEIPTKYLISNRQKEAGKETTCNTKYGLYKHNAKDVHHIVNFCLGMFVRYYLPNRQT